MTRKLASTLTLVSTAAAMFAFAAIASNNAYADDITVDTTPFVSTKTRAEVRAEVIGHAEDLRIAYGESSMPTSLMSQAPSGLTREQVKAEYIAARRDVNAFNAEDSGSSYLTSQQRRNHGVVVAGSER